MKKDDALEKGIRVEKEHQGTYDWLKQRFESKSFPEPREFFEQIALDHLDEHLDYYDLLEKMEASLE